MSPKTYRHFRRTRLGIDQPPVTAFLLVLLLSKIFHGWAVSGLEPPISNYQSNVTRNYRQHFRSSCGGIESDFQPCYWNHCLWELNSSYHWVSWCYIYLVLNGWAQTDCRTSAAANTCTIAALELFCGLNKPPNLKSIMKHFHNRRFTPFYVMQGALS